MQQTETYKLNKPEQGDVFSTAPLNENADKLESELTRVDAAVARCRAENCLVKLGGPLGVQYKGQPIEFDLSDLDLSQYRVLILVGGVINAASLLRINDDTSYHYTLHGYNIDSGGISFFTHTAKGYLIYSAFYGDYQCGDEYKILMSDLYRISLVSETQEPGSSFTLYGIKA